MRQTSRYWVLALFVAMAGLVTSGCGDDDGDDTTTSDTGTDDPPDDPPDDPGGTAATADDTALTTRNIPVLIDVIANDTLTGDWDIVALSAPARGRADLGSDGVVRFTPAADDPGGTVEFTYTLRERGGDGEETGSVEVQIAPALGTVSGGRLYEARAIVLEEYPLGIEIQDINNNGDVVASCLSVEARTQCIIEADGTVNEIVLQADAFEWATGLNDNGDFIGLWCDDVSCSGAKNVGGTLEDLDSFAPWNLGNDGTITGLKVFDAMNVGTVIAPDGTETAITNDLGRTFTNVAGANAAGDLVAFSEDGVADDRCHIYPAGGGMRETLERAPGGAELTPSCFDINDAQEVVGFVGEGASFTNSRAVRWDADGAHFVNFPFAPGAGASDRVELLWGNNNSGTLAGYYRETRLVEGQEDRQTVFTGVVLNPVDAPENTSYEDTDFGYIEATQP